MIDKDTIADAMGLENADMITDDVYNFAKARFYALTGYTDAEQEVIFKKLILSPKTYIKTNYRNIASVDSIVIDGEEQDFTLYTDLRFNSDSGLIEYSQGFSGQVEITMTIGAYTHSTLCDYLISLLTYKAVLIFTPQYSENIKRIKIDDYEKELYATTTFKKGIHDTIDGEIEMIVNTLLGKNNNAVSFGDIL